MPDGTPVDLYVLSGENGLSAEVIALGCRIVRLSAPDREGKCVNVVLGYDTLAEYVENRDYQGTAVGRYANRIGGASFSIDGKTYSLAKNDGENSLHGGPTGFAHRVWTVKESGDTPDGPSITFSYTSVDGEEGFPGTLTAEVTCSLTEDGALTLDYRAESDADTLCSLTNHSYFNLAGHDGGEVLNQEVWLNASSYTPADAGSIPTGEIAPVAGTPMDFTQMKAIGQDIEADFEQLVLGNGYDHNWVLDHEPGVLSLAARARDPKSGRVMETYTDLPGVQFYTANGLKDFMPGKGGVHYGRRQAYCFETQYYPDAVHKENFPSPFLKAGEEYHTVTVYRFTTDGL